MRTSILVIAVGIFLAVWGCGESSTGPGPLEPDLYGSWTLTLRSGGLAGRIIYPDGINAYSVNISLNNTFVEARNDTVIFSQAFIVRFDSTYKKNIIDFTDSRWFSHVIVRTSYDSLVLWDGFIDGYTSVYVRQKQ
jgi:hypothetical protein